MLPQALQLTPSSPLYTVTKVLLHKKDQADQTLNNSIFEAIRMTVLHEARSNKMPTQCAKYNLSIFVKDEQAIKKRKLQEDIEKQKRSELMLLEEVERVKRESEKAVAEAEEMAKALRNAEEQKKVSDKNKKLHSPARESLMKPSAPTPDLMEYHDAASPPTAMLMTPQSKRSSSGSTRTPGSASRISPWELEAAVGTIAASVEGSPSLISQSPALAAAVQAAEPVVRKIKSRQGSPIEMAVENCIGASPGTPEQITRLSSQHEEESDGANGTKSPAVVGASLVDVGIGKSKSIEERKSSLSIKAEETDDQKVLGETAEDETDLTATEENFFEAGTWSE